MNRTGVVVVGGAVIAVVALTSLGGCVPAPATADMFATLGFSGATATLRVLDDDGPVTFDVRLPDESLRRAAGEAEVPCEPDGGTGSLCTASVVIDPGRYRFVLEVGGRDRCGSTAPFVELSSGDEPVTVARWDNVDVDFDVARTDFDDDADGIVNALEPLVCGRLDRPDGAQPPADCVDPADPCCASDPAVAPSPLQGQRTVFDGGRHTRADGTVVEVPAFALDATELTWSTFARCVAAGACLAGQPEHPVRARLATAVLDERAPVTGLLPVEAAALCAWQGGRLPDDDEWDFAAAHRDDGSRARYPFDDVAADGFVECREGPGPAANHGAHGRDCPSGPVAVGSYPSTFARRGVGAPLADLAGNAAVWTVRRGAGAAAAGFPDGVVEVALRGGGAGGIVELLENDVALRVVPGDERVIAEQLAGLARGAGVRCAFDAATEIADPGAPLVEEQCPEAP